MKTWRFVLVGAVLTAMAITPKSFITQKAESPEAVAIKPMASLKLEKVSHFQPLASRSPLSIVPQNQKPLAGMKICVDAGHGGQAKWDKILYCGGTVGCATGNTESDVNLRVALCLRQYLEAAGAQVIMTRLMDERCTMGGKEEELDFRSNLANAKGCDLFISVHHNEGTDRSTNYTAVFYPSGTAPSIPLAENISSAVSRYLGTQNVGAKSGNYRVLSKIKMPGVIVEASFMSNPTEDQRLAQLSYNKMEAKAIATGILNYVRVSKGRNVDFNTIFAPIDDKAHSAQAIADATFIRKQILERRSLFGAKYEEVTYDAQGQVIARREIGASSLVAKKALSAKNKAKSVASKSASSAKKVVSKSTSSAKNTASKVTSTAKKATSSKKLADAGKSSSKTSSKKSTSKKATN